MTKTRIVSLASLGLCEHCNALLTIEDLPGDSLSARWECASCSKELTGLSFGYNEKNKKVRWVGPGGVWTTERPTVSFELGNWHVTYAAIASAN